MVLISAGEITLYVFLGFLSLILFLVLLILGLIAFIYFNPLIFIKKFMRKPQTKDEILKSLRYPNNFETIYKDECILENDLVYSNDYLNSTYDLYLPKNKKKVPLIIWIHGGAFVAGEKEGTYALGHMLAKDGYATISINYRLAPEASFFDIAKQVESLMNFVVEKYKSHDVIDTSRIIIVGDSAGGHIALSYVLTQFNDIYSNKMKIDSKHKNLIKGMLLLCNPYDLVALGNQKDIKLKFFVNAFSRKYFREAKWKKNNGELGTFYNYVTSDFPKCYLTDGNNFSFMVQSLKFKKVLDQKGVYNESLYYENDKKVNHEYNFELDTPEAIENYNKMIGFLNRVTSDK